MNKNIKINYQHQNYYQNTNKQQTQYKDAGGQVSEYCTTVLELACFVCYLKIVNTFTKMYASYGKLSKKLKNDIKI